MSLAKRCTYEFQPADRRRGEAYFAQGRCQLGALNGEEVTAQVTGSGGAIYQAVVDWSLAALDDALLVACECPRFADGELCKHLWATLRALDQAGHGRRVPGSGPLTLFPEPELVGAEPGWDDDEDDDEDDDDWFWDEEPFDPGAAELLKAGYGPVLGPRQGWRRQLDGIRSALEARAASAMVPGSALLRRRREAWYLLDLSACLESNRLMVNLYQREERKNGELGKIKSLTVDESEIDSFSQAEDREALRLLLAANPPPAEFHRDFYFLRYGQRPRYSAAAVPGALYEAVLPRLCATGRFILVTSRHDDLAEAPRLTWDEGPPYRLALRLESLGDKEGVRLTGELRRPGESRPLSEPALLMADGLAVFAQALARLDARKLFPWIVTLRREGEIPIPAGQEEAFLRELNGLPALPELTLPPELGLEEVRLPPRPGVAFRSPGEGVPVLEARPTFDYGGREVAAGQGPDTLIDLEGKRLLPRDPAAEAAALDRLGELGLRPSEDAEEGWPLELDAGALPRVVEALLAEGWTVQAEGRLVRRPGAFQLRVSSGVDWFDLEGEVDFEGEPVPLPRLLEAVSQGRRWVRLDDGTQGMLSEEWLERYTPLAELVRGKGKQDELRILPSQALLLDALLAETRVELEADRTFARLRERLASFEGVEPLAEPRGFQGTLRPYQKEGLGWLVFLQEVGLGGCLADDMGLGKTIQVLALFQRRRLGRPAGGERRPHLVVAPRSLVYNWLDEASRFTPRLKLLDYTGSGRAEKRRRFSEYDAVVTTYGTLRRDAAHLKELELDYAVLDEAQAIKNPASQSAKACRLIRARHRLALTGTPVENHLGELWSIFEFLNPGMLGRLPKLKGAGGGDTRGDTRGNNRGDTPAEESLELISRALRPVILRRTKEQVLTDLPEKTEQTLLCELSRRERKLYDELRDHYRARLTRQIEEVGLARSKLQVLEALLRLRQAACHPALLDRGRADEGSAKLETLLEQLDEVLGEGHKALVFSQFVSLLTLVRRRLDERRIPYEYLDGRTRKRKERVERFQNDPGCPLFLISLKAGGLGLNLTAADYVFLLDPWWNPAVEAQAVDRAHRIGQSRPVFAYRLIARDTVEEKIQALQQSKRELARAILSADKSAIRNLTAEDLELLLS